MALPCSLPPILTFSWLFNCFNFFWRDHVIQAKTVETARRNLVKGDCDRSIEVKITVIKGSIFRFFDNWPLYRGWPLYTRPLNTGSIVLNNSRSYRGCRDSYCTYPWRWIHVLLEHLFFFKWINVAGIVLISFFVNILGQVNFMADSYQPYPDLLYQKVSVCMCMHADIGGIS